MRMAVVCDHLNIYHLRLAPAAMAPVVMRSVDLLHGKQSADDQAPERRKQQQKTDAVGDKSRSEQQHAGERDHQSVHAVFNRRFAMHHALLGVEQRAHALPANQ